MKLTVFSLAATHDAQSRCAYLVLADSLNPISSKGYKFSAHPAIVKQYELSYAALSKQTCDVLVPVHRDADELRAQAGSGKLVGDGGDCKRYVEESRGLLKQRLAKEHAAVH